ncbi:MAG: hypothetical protein Q9162_005544 [Coniocarpon cinnabarinum]
MSTQQAQKPPRYPRPTRICVHQDPSPRNPLGQLGTSAAPVSETIRVALEKLDPPQPSNATDGRRLKLGKAHGTTGKGHARASVLHPGQKNVKVISPNQVAERDVHVTPQKRRILEKDHQYEKNAIKPVNSPKTTKFDAERGSRYGPGKVTPRKLIASHLSRVSPARVNSRLQKGSNNNSQKPPFVLKAQSARSEVTVPPNTHAKASHQIAPLHASDVIFNEHPLALVFDKQIEVYRRDLTASHTATIERELAKLIAAHEDIKSKEQQLRKEYVASSGHSFTPLAPEKVNQSTLGNVLETWRKRAKDHDWPEYKKLAMQYNGVLQSMTKLKREMGSEDRQLGKYVNEVAAINLRFEEERKQSAESMKKELELVAEQLKKSELAAKNDLEKVRKRLEAFMESVETEAGGDVD